MRTDFKNIELLSGGRVRTLEDVVNCEHNKYECAKQKIRGCAITDIYISNIEFTECYFEEDYFHEVRFVRCVFNKCGFTDTTFFNCSFHDCKFTNGEIRTNLFRYGFMDSCKIANTEIYGTHFHDMSFWGTEFSETDSVTSNFHNCELQSAINAPHVMMSCPTHGSFIGWKKVHWKGEHLLIKLRIPADAKRSSATNRKCRAEYAKVLGIYTEDLKRTNITKVINTNYARCVYEVGETVYPDGFNKNRYDECSHGIHFFIDAQDAINY